MPVVRRAALSAARATDFQIPARRSAAFTLLELLLVISIIGVLAGLLMPALIKTKETSTGVACLNNLKQLALGTIIYQADNSGRLIQNLPMNGSTNNWVAGNMKVLSESGAAGLRQGTLFPYIHTTKVFTCPLDLAHGSTDWRSYSMNGWMGSRVMSMNRLPQKNYRTFIRDTELTSSGSQALWLLTEEDPKTLDDGFFTTTMLDQEAWLNAPTLRHGSRYPLAFVDGHLALVRATQVVRGPMMEGNPDWERFKAMTTLP